MIDQYQKSVALSETGDKISLLPMNLMAADKFALPQGDIPLIFEPLQKQETQPYHGLSVLNHAGAFFWLMTRSDSLLIFYPDGKNLITMSSYYEHQIHAYSISIYHKMQSSRLIMFF